MILKNNFYESYKINYIKLKRNVKNNLILWHNKNKKEKEVSMDGTVTEKGTW